MTGAAPVTRLALAFAAGAAWALAGAPMALAPLAALLLLAAPNPTSRRPVWAACWLLAGLAGMGGTRSLTTRAESCSPASLGEPAALQGRFLASAVAGSASFVSESGCGPFTVVIGGEEVVAGTAMLVEGVWREGRQRAWFLAHSASPVPGPDGWRWRSVQWRDGIVRRLDRLYAERAPLVAALTLARREGLDLELREAFARVGIAHLLAISGFHVGVIAGLLLVGIVSLGVAGRRAALLAAAGSWVYVAFIGFPDAACRAALILSAVALARARGRPSSRWAALGAALLVLLVLDPRRLGGPGFQLSFAGAAGLTAWSGPLSRWMTRRFGRACPRPLAAALAAGLAATLATLPVVAWHFERVSLVGIPVTLLATPLVTLSLVGSLASIAMDFVAPQPALIVAGGVDLVLAALERLALWAGAFPWASVWTTRSSVLGGLAGVGLAWWIARQPHLGARARRGLTVCYVAAGVVAWPLALTLQGRGSVEIVMIDVGQGDAIALRGPGGRWLLVDTGPAGAEADPAGHPVVRALRSRGVRRLEALVLTHSDLDHIGGAVAVLESFDVGAVYDPGLPAGKEAFVGVLEVAADRGVPWRAARVGDRLDLGSLQMRVLYPPADLASDAESNASSVVLLASFGDFDALLTGDAYKDVDRLVASEVSGVVEVLKVGHHGSDTSTDPALLAAAQPKLALVSVGRYNRYGHPAPEVLRRLDQSGVRVLRTDRSGSVTVVGRADGDYSVGSRR